MVEVENNRNVVVENKRWGRVSVGPCSVDVGSMYGRCGRGRKLKIKSKIKREINQLRKNKRGVGK